MDIQTIQVWLPIIKDTITTLAALTAAVIAIMGFRTWKKQLHWKTQYELAQRLAKAVYKLKEAIAEYRSPLTLFAEPVAETQPKENRVVYGKHFFTNPAPGEIENTYSHQWQKLQEAITDLDAVVLEAESIWGEAVVENIKPLRKCITILLEYKRDSRKLSESTDLTNPSDVKKLYEAADILSDSHSENNQFSKEITAAVRKIENFLKPYLKI